jgi:hypothetical protein
MMVRVEGFIERRRGLSSTREPSLGLEMKRCLSRQSDRAGKGFEPSKVESEEGDGMRGTPSPADIVVDRR